MNRAEQEQEQEQEQPKEVRISEFEFKMSIAQMMGELLSEQNRLQEMLQQLDTYNDHDFRAEYYLADGRPMVEFRKKPQLGYNTSQIK